MNRSATVSGDAACCQLLREILLYNITTNAAAYRLTSHVNSLKLRVIDLWPVAIVAAAKRACISERKQAAASDAAASQHSRPIWG